MLNRNQTVSSFLASLTAEEEQRVFKLSSKKAASIRKPRGTGTASHPEKAPASGRSEADKGFHGGEEEGQKRSHL